VVRWVSQLTRFRLGDQLDLINLFPTNIKSLVRGK